MFQVTKAFALFAGIYYFRHLTPPYKLTMYLVAIAIFFESYGYYIRSTGHMNAWLFNFYIPIEMWLLGVAGMYFLPNRRVKMITAIFLIISTIIWASNIVANTVYVYANYAMACGALILTVLYFAVLFANSLFNTKQILRQPLFWLALSNILYFGCIVPFLGLFQYLTQMPTLGKELATINYILNFIRYPMVGVSFILLGREHFQAIKST